MGIEAWWSDGEQVKVRLGGSERAIFVRQMGVGQSMTLLHGFPSSSFDWAKAASRLRVDHVLLMPDFLGFGASEKPAEHDYSIHEQADLVEAIWAHGGITSTVLVAHDYGASVAQELLARRDEGPLSVDILTVHLLNGGLYPELAILQPGQEALLDPDHGSRISAMLSEERWIGSLQPTFAPNFDSAADSIDNWRAMSREGGHLIAHRLIHYVADRAVHGNRWIAALEGTDVPVTFVWGMLDPVSGEQMADRIRERLPEAPFTALEDVGHWPALEAPERVADAILAR